MSAPLPFRVVSCSEWGAKPPKAAISYVDAPNKSIFHHTAGHVPNLSAGETYEEACAYARAIQHFHMAPGGLGAPKGGLDSGHNFLVTRGGYILEGRHGSLQAVRSGKMVASAHCPGQNDQPGVEHEHNGSEAMTPIQRSASVWLHAWIARCCQIEPASLCQPHRRYYSTSCPGSLAGGLPALRKEIAAELAPAPSAWWGPFIAPMSKADQKRAFALLREAQNRYAP